MDKNFKFSMGRWKDYRLQVMEEARNETKEVNDLLSEVLNSITVLKEKVETSDCKLDETIIDNIMENMNSIINR